MTIEPYVFTQQEIDEEIKERGRNARMTKGVFVEPLFNQPQEYRSIMGFKKLTDVNPDGTAKIMGQELADTLLVLDGTLSSATNKEHLTVDRLNMKYQYDGQWFLAYDVIEVDEGTGKCVGVYSGFIRGATPWECLSQLDEDIDADTAVLRKNKYRTTKDVQSQMNGKKSKGFGSRKKK